MEETMTNSTESYGAASGAPMHMPAENFVAGLDEAPALLAKDDTQNFSDENTAEKTSYSLEDYEINVPETISPGEIDEQVLGRFKAFCASTGLSPEQAQQAVDFYFSEFDAGREGAFSSCEDQLRELWRDQYSSRLTAAQRACRMMDQRLGGRLMPLVSAGLGNNPVFGELMAEVGAALSEDSFGLQRGAASGDAAMSTEDFLRKIVFRNK